MANSTPEELLARAIEKARKAGLEVRATSTRLDEDGVTVSKNY
jgi:hypothetical protein